MIIRVVNQSKHELPHYATELSAGLDLRANINAPIELKPLERTLVPTGLFIELHKGYEAQIRPRSGLAFNSIGESMFALKSKPAESSVAYCGNSCFDWLTILTFIILICFLTT